MGHARVHSLAGFGLEVPDVDQARAFYSAFGLVTLQGSLYERRLDAAARTLALGCEGVAAPSVLVLPGPAKRLHHLSFYAEAHELPQFETRLRALGTPPATPPFANLRPGLWFQDPWGTWFNLTPSTAAERPVPQPVAPAAERIDRHLWQELPRDARPDKLGHILVFTPDLAEAEAYLGQALGLRTSDRSAGKVAFMAGGSGVRDHHCFGLVASTHRGYQHASFHVDSIDALGFGGWKMREAGFGEQFGPGRHALASNLFLYVRDPWGSWVEYYSDMDKVSEAWVTRDWNNLPYVWGPTWSPEFWGQEMNGNFEPR